MQQYVSNGTVGSKLARANMKPANPRARPRNLETVTAARGVALPSPACLLACPPASFWFPFFLPLRLCAGDRCDLPAPL